jgi:folate-binding protein YgfZ
MIIGTMTSAPTSCAETLAGDSRFSGAVRLADWGLIRARGADAVTFLQGQLTNDLAPLGANQARLAGFCTAKGRLLASFVAWQAGPDEWLLACSADLLAPTLKRLSMFVLRAKCQLSDASAELPLWGVAGEAAQQWLGADTPAAPWAVRRKGEAQVVRLPDASGCLRCLAIGPALDQALADVPALHLEAWRWLEVQSGVVRIVAATSEAFVPQMVNFELVGGVSFKKGCYPGQEVVARSQYRGTLKRRGALLSAETPLAPGQEVFHAARLQARPLPYTLPGEAAA